MSSRFVEMGEIVNVVGLRGEIKVLNSGNYDEAILRSSFLRMRDEYGSMRPVKYRRHRYKGGTVVIQLDELNDRDAAEAVVGQSLGYLAADYDDPGFPRGSVLPPFVYHGLDVVTTDGRSVGVVDDVLTLPANWVLRVLSENEGTETEFLIPVIDDVIREVDREGGRVVIQAIDGLLGDDDA